MKAFRQVLKALGVQVQVRRDVNNKAIGIEFSLVSRDERGAGSIVSTNIGGREIVFFVENASDEVQRYHFDGRFYEQEELDLISRHFKGGVFLDIGANVGNHTLYVLKFLGATKVIAIEPNPAAYRILKCNMALNDVDRKVEVHKIGFSDKASHGSLQTSEDNLGKTFVVDKPSGPIELLRGDDFLCEEHLDFVKIDAEGSELRVLDGLAMTIERHRPPIFVEVDYRNVGRFMTFVALRKYHVVSKYKRYKSEENFLIVPMPE
jgi:FkbM family methyltransferase